MYISIYDIKFLRIYMMYISTYDIKFLRIYMMYMYLHDIKFLRIYMMYMYIYDIKFLRIYMMYIIMFGSEFNLFPNSIISQFKLKTMGRKRDELYYDFPIDLATIGPLIGAKLSENG